MKSVALCSMLAVFASAWCSEGTDVAVEILVFSGNVNPTVVLSHEDKLEFCNAAAKMTWPSRTCHVLGFSGWRVCSDGSCHIFRGDRHIDWLLSNAVRRELPADVVDHIQEETARYHGSHASCENDEAGRFVPSPFTSCEAPVIGSDNPAHVRYDLEHDVSGCFVAMCGKNNCYNYANDIVTNTFAQPGQGSGHLYSWNSCEAVKDAAISDGLKWVGHELPTTLPEFGHYVSLHMWPARSFHWLRMDADTKWSHKPGYQKARQVDNRGRKITNPAQAHLGPFKQHCGYMLAVPSKVAGVIHAIEE